MRPILTIAATLSLALLMIGSARAAQEFRCMGPESITGNAIDSATIVTHGFRCEAADFNSPGFPYTAWGDAVNQTNTFSRARQTAAPRPLFAVQFKNPTTEMKVGEPVTVTGIFFVVLNPAQHSAHLLIKNAEIVK